MLVTVILPLYNGRRYVRDALNSIFAQTYLRLEVIIVNDGSTDDSAEIVQSYPRVIYLYQSNQGNALARMKGIENASGELIAFLDQDDQWMPNKVALQVETFRKDPACQCVIGRARYFVDEGCLPPKGLKEKLFEEDRLSYLPGVFMARRELLRKIPFSPSYVCGSDTDWFFRLHEANIPVTILPDLLLKVRMHADNLSHQVAKTYRELLQVIGHSLQRKLKIDPVVSVIIPVYNGEKYLRSALESVFAQTYSSLEVIIVDDGSTDGSRAIALSFGEKVRYVYQAQSGIATARNRGITVACGAYFSFLDCDDLWRPNKLSEQMALFSQDSNLDMAFGKMVNFFSPELPEENVQKYRTPLGEAAGWVAGTLLVKRESFHKVGLFNTSFQVGEFIDWCARAKKEGLKIAVMEQLFLDRRIHGENTTLKRKTNLSDYLQILRKQLR